MLPTVKAVACDEAIKTPTMQSSKRTENIFVCQMAEAENCVREFKEETTGGPRCWRPSFQQTEGKGDSNLTMTAEDHIARMLRGTSSDPKMKDENLEGIPRPAE